MAVREQERSTVESDMDDHIDDYRAYLSLPVDDKFNPWAAPLWPDHVLASLICPRPFMVEAGRYDPVIDWRDAESEFGRVRHVYRQRGVEARAELVVAEWGGHEMFHDGPQRFLDRWLGAPASHTAGP